MCIYIQILIHTYTHTLYKHVYIVYSYIASHFLWCSLTDRWSTSRCFKDLFSCFLGTYSGFSQNTFFYFVVCIELHPPVPVVVAVRCCTSATSALYPLPKQRNSTQNTKNLQCDVPKKTREFQTKSTFEYGAKFQ